MENMQFMQRHMEAIQSMISEAMQFFTNIERQRDDVAPPGMHLPMSIHVRDGRRGLIVKTFSLLPEDDDLVVAKLMDRVFDDTHIRQQTNTLDNVKLIGHTGYLAFKPMGTRLQDLMVTVDQVCEKLNVSLPMHVMFYNSFPGMSRRFVRACILSDKADKVKEWNALPEDYKKTIIRDLDQPNVFFNRNLVYDVI